MRALRYMVCLVAIGLVAGCSRSPSAQITGISLRDLDGPGATFHGFFVADGMTNVVRASMPTNFTVFAHALSFEFVRDQRSPQGFELVVSRSDRRERNAYSQQGIRGHWLQKDDGSDEWLSQPFTE